MRTVSFQGTRLTDGQRRRMDKEREMRSAFINPFLTEQVDSTFRAVEALKERWFDDYEEKGTLCVDTGVILNIKLAKNEPDFANALNGVPPIKTVSLVSNVRVKLGTTIALGGVYSTIQATQEHRVPGLASIPFLGRIFRYETQSSTTADLILFITPTLVPATDIAQAM